MSIFSRSPWSLQPSRGRAPSACCARPTSGLKTAFAQGDCRQDDMGSGELRKRLPEVAVAGTEGKPTPSCLRVQSFMP